MNAEEGTSMAKMAVSVLLVVLIIGAVVGVVYAAYSWFNSGTARLTETVNGITQSAMSQYDNQVVKGSDVTAALKNYRDSEYAILISTLSQGGYKAYTAAADGTSQLLATNYCSIVRVDALSAQTADTNKGIVATEAQTAGTAAQKDCTKGSTKHYTVQVVRDPAGSGNAYASQVVVDNVAWDSNTGLTLRDTNFSPTATSVDGDAYVKTSASFYSVLIYSRETGDVCGIMFLQQN